MSIFDYGRNAKQPRGMQECTPEAFDKIIDDPKVEKICAEIQDLREKKLRGEITDKEYKDARTPLKTGLPVFTFQAHYKDGYRKNANAIASGLSILDIDNTPPSLPEGEDVPLPLIEQITRHLLSLQPITEKELVDKLQKLGIVLVHVSPSLEGLHVVFKTPAGMDHAEAQKWMAAQLNSDYDVCAKDGARCSYAVPREYIIYIDRKGLFTPPNLPDTPPNLPEGEEPIAADNQTEATSRPLVGETERGYATSKQAEESPSGGIPSPNLSRSTGEELQSSSKLNEESKASNTFSPTCGRDQREGMPRVNSEEESLNAQPSTLNETESIGERKSVKLNSLDESEKSVVKQPTAIQCLIFDICRQFAGLSTVDIETKGMRL